MEDGLISITKFRRGLAGLSLGDQKRIFDTLPDDIQSALWLDRLQEGIETVHDKGQKTLLGNLCDLLSPDAYSDPKENKAATAAIDKMQPLIQRLFPDFKVFNRYTEYLGDDPCPPSMAPKGGGRKQCECSSANSGALFCNDCGGLMECRKGNCAPSNWGCGCLWLQACDGLCTGRIDPGPAF